MKFLLISGMMILIVVLGLALAVVINAFRFQSRQIQVQQIERAQVDQRLALERFSRALQFETVSYPEPVDFNPEPFLDLGPRI